MTATEESVLTIPAKVKKDGITYTVTETPDGDGAFYKSAYTKIILPNTLTKIGDCAFYQSSLTSITIPDSVTSIGRYAFYYIAITSINISEGVTSIGEYAFRCCENLTSITIPSNVTSLYTGAFYNCSNLTSITFEDADNWFWTFSSTLTRQPMDVTNLENNADIIISMNNFAYKDPVYFYKETA